MNKVSRYRGLAVAMVFWTAALAVCSDESGLAPLDGGPSLDQGAAPPPAGDGAPGPDGRNHDQGAGDTGASGDGATPLDQRAPSDGTPPADSHPDSTPTTTPTLCAMVFDNDQQLNIQRSFCPVGHVGARAPCHRQRHRSRVAGAMGAGPEIR